MEQQLASHRRPDAAPDAGAARAVRIDKVRKVYESRNGSVEAIASVDVVLDEGQAVSIVGPSGCGKSTLMRMIAGLEPITSGEIRIGDELVDGPIDDVGIVFQKDLLLDWRSVVDNVMLPAELKGLDLTAARARAKALLEELDVADFAQHYPWQLSGGMRQRVAIARALLAGPRMMFLDEPFSALDAMTRDQMNVLFQRVQSVERVSTLLITHSILEAVFIADRVLVMSGRPGRIVDDIAIDFPRPRHLSLRETPAFGAIVGRIRQHFERSGDLAE